MGTSKDFVELVMKNREGLDSRTHENDWLRPWNGHLNRLL